MTKSNPLAVVKFFRELFSTDILLVRTVSTLAGFGRSWIERDEEGRYWIVILGHDDDVFHEIVHILDLAVGTDDVCDLLGVNYEDLHVENFGGTRDDARYDEEDFADMVEVILKSMWECTLR